MDQSVKSSELCCLNIGFKAYQVAESGGRRCVEKTRAHLEPCACIGVLEGQLRFSAWHKEDEVGKNVI